MPLLTHSSLPSWRIISKAFGLFSAKPLQANPWCSEGEHPFWFSCSAWSLAVVASLKIDMTKKGNVKIWIPDYFCNSSLVPLRKTGSNLVFYPVTENFEPNYEVCKELTKNNSIDVFILVHYFGLPADASRAREFCNNNDAWLLEDATHVLKKTRGIGDYGDFVLYSPHKHLPIPDGAVMVVRTKVLGKKQNVNIILKNINTIHLKMLRESSSFLLQPLLWLIKRSFQKLGIRSLCKNVSRFQSDESSILNTSPAMSGLAKKLLPNLIHTLDSVKSQRQENLKTWDYLITTFDNLEICRRDVKKATSPYLATYQCDNLNHAEKMFKSFKKRGLPVSTWPDLPPEVRLNHVSHSGALKLRQHRLFFPVHQSLSINSLVKNFSMLKVMSSGKIKVRLVFSSITESYWNSLMLKVGRSNLLQSWEYGEAKHEIEGWQVHRGVFFAQNDPIAIVQVLKKTYFGFIHVYRVNRGPLFIGQCTDKDISTTLQLLSKLGCWWLGRILFIAPELKSKGLVSAMLSQQKFRKSETSSWSSSWLNLSSEVDHLRKNLDGKWRNMLKVSEKHGMVFEAGSDDQIFQWMKNQYINLMSQKNFKGIDISILTALRENMTDKKQMLILRALHNNEPVAGICIVLHAAAATYLVGWNGDTGRSLKANQFLLWNSIILLKKNGCLWFDLGGIDEVNTPGISEFKLGLNGDRYWLTGEYRKL